MDAVCLAKSIVKELGGGERSEARRSEREKNNSHSSLTSDLPPLTSPQAASARVALAPPRLKVEYAAVDTTKPFVARDVMFIFSSHLQFLSLVVVLRIERSATRLSDAFERPALDYRSIKSGASESTAPFSG
jgi:hypothetical protein